MDSIAPLLPQQRNFRPLPNSTTGNESLVDMIGRKNIAQALIGVLGVGVVAATAAGFVAGGFHGGSSALALSSLLAGLVAKVAGRALGLPLLERSARFFFYSASIGTAASLFFPGLSDPTSNHQFKFIFGLFALSTLFCGFLKRKEP